MNDVGVTNMAERELNSFITHTTTRTQHERGCSPVLPAACAAKPPCVFYASVEDHAQQDVSSRRVALKPFIRMQN